MLVLDLERNITNIAENLRQPLRNASCPQTVVILEMRDSQKPREAGAGWKPLFTRILASNKNIKRGIGFFLMSMVFS